MPITTEQLIGLCRDGCLYHLAQVGSWPSIQEHGLRSTSALLDLYRYEGDRRNAIECQHRANSVPLVANDGSLLPTMIRDQRPLNEAMLRRCLEACTPEQFHKLLNGRVFFWLSFARVVRMMNAYRDCEHDLLIIDARRFIDAYAGRIELSPLNSGSVRSVDHKRGLDLFRKLNEYPFNPRARNRWGSVAELTVRGEVEDISNFVTRVDRI